MEPDEGGLVAPVLEQASPFPIVRRPVEEGAVVGAETREQRDVVRPHEHVDRVDLDEAESLENARRVAPAGVWRARLAEA
jgi:hypothetical protein